MNGLALLGPLPALSESGVAGRLARAAILAVIAVRVLVGPLADASPVDPSWIPGFYDDGDFDDLVTQLALLASACDWSVAPVLTWTACGTIAALDAERSAPAAGIAAHDRAPPLG